MLKTISGIVFASALVVATSSAMAAPSSGEVAWTKCASDGISCADLKGGNTVRYGYAGNWATKDFKGAVACNKANFEADSTVEGYPFAATDQEKICEVAN